MNEKKTTITLEILLLNDLLRTKVIDENLYNMASKIIISGEKQFTTQQPAIAATA